MPTTYTSLLGLALPATGELSGTWGSTVNTEITSLLDTAVAGTTTLSTDADVTLSTTTGAANQARQAIILWTANGTVTRNITAPAASKTYVVINASAGTQSIVFRGVGPTAGVTVVKGESAVVAWNGSDFIKVSNTSGAGAFTNLSVSGTTTLSGLTASTALALDASKNVVSVTNTGTGNNVLATSPVLTTPNLGTPSAIVLTNASGTASININGTVGATTPNTGAFTTLSASGVATFSAGTAAAPALTTIGDTDTGVFFPAANTWAVATGASERMRITSGGDVGIGMTPGTKLDVQGDITARGASISSAAYINMGTAYTAAYLEWAPGSSQLTIMNSQAGPLRFATNNGERMRIDSSGNVGIGTAAPLQPLHVIGNGRFQGNIFNVNGFATVDLLESATGVGFRWALANNGTFRLQRSANGTYSDATTPILFDASGNVGIGTTSPAALLDVGQTGGTTVIRSLQADSGAGTFAQILAQKASGPGVEMIVDTAAGYVGTAGAYPLVLRTNYQERMRISSGGNVGIGTTDPQATLHVAGTILSASSFGNLATLQAVGGTGFRWTLNNDGTYRLQRTTDAFVSVTTPILFDSSSRAIIGGTTAIGGTASVWNGLYLGANDSTAEFQNYRASDNSGAAFQYLNKARGTIASPTVVQNGDGLGSQIWRGYDGASYVQAAIIRAEVDGTPGSGDMPGRLVFLTTLDGASTATERMRIDSSGNVGIGDTSPASRGRLSVLSTSGAGRQFVVKTDGTAELRYDDNSNPRVLSLQNYGMTGANHGASILWSLGNTTANANDAGLISVIAEGVWGATAASRDASMLIAVARDGTLAECARFKSTGQVRFVPLSADPANAQTGDVYYNDATNKLRVYNGTTWENLH